ncbi:MAG TPA: right-handed parallel beta-helix repeat-containing protein [Phycisphaerales bacterium]|nr:right-handed parallel beta-helix repeat-containing protein [Phycisphaerales bacterium]
MALRSKMGVRGAWWLVPAAALGIVVAAVAGPLNPPAGPVGPTAKTLAEVEPRVAVNATNTPGDATSVFRIVQPGSYYLAGNLAGVSGKHGIVITASGVTLDLNGFDVVGVAGSLDGVSATAASLGNIAVRNGSVRSWGGDGVKLGVLTSSNCSVTDVLSRQNAGNGIVVGSSAAVRGCQAFNNTLGGISTYVGAMVTECIAASNQTDGISCEYGSTVSGCLAQNNRGAGIRVSFGCNVLSNVCAANGGPTAGGKGVQATGSDNRIEGNNCVSNDKGIVVDVAGNVIVRNTCSGNFPDWVIAANNVYGPIVDRRAPASGAVSGYSGAGSLGTTDANANFSY